jgi:hypothetical protein
MVGSCNATALGDQLQIPSYGHGCGVETRLSNTVLKVESSPEILRFDAGISAGATRLNAEIEPPVLACKSFFTSQGDFVNQADLERQWAALKELLRTATFAEQEVLEVLSSGILQTETGKAIAGVFADAILRSIRPVGELTTASLREIVDVLCHLPPGKWQAAFGENVRFASGQSSEGVAGFIQSHLNHSSVQRDEQIANNELASDSQWEAIKQITVKARQYIHRSSESSLNSVLMMLEDVYRCRPTMKEAQSLIADFLCELGQPVHSDRVRWPDRFLNEVETLNDQLKPVEDNKETWLQWLVGPSWLESLAGHPVSLSAPLKALAIPVRTLWGKLSSETAPESPLSSDPSTADSVQPDFNLPKAKASAPSLLSYLQSFERNADFHTSVATTGPRIPESFVGKLLWASKMLDTFGARRLDNSHVSTACPDPKSSRHSRTYGADEFPAPSFDTLPTPLQTSIRSAPQWPALGQFAAQVDDVVSQIVHNMMPWDSAHCSDVEEVRVLLEPFTSFDHPPVYQPPSETLSDQPSVSLENSLLALNVVGEQLQSWLARMSASLVSSGVAVLSRTGDLIEQHPGKTAGVFAAYMAISNFYANWFLPEPEEMVDPLQGLVPELYDEAEQYFIREYTLEGVADLLQELPDFAEKAKQLVSQSDYLDPCDDPQLAEDIEALLLNLIPGTQNVTYQNCLDETIRLAVLDAQDELHDDSVNGSPIRVAVASSADASLDHKTSFIVDNLAIPYSMLEIDGHAYARLMIEATLRLLDAEISVQPGEEIAPGVTIEQGADKFIDTFMAARTIFDPAFFMQKIINKTIDDSDLPRYLRSRLTFDTEFKVIFRTYRGGQQDHLPLYSDRSKSFTLVDLFAGQHDKDKVFREQVIIEWGQGYTRKFISAVAENNFQSLYKDKMQEVTSQSEVADLWKLDKKRQLLHAVEVYSKGENSTASGKKVATDFLQGNIKVKPIAIRNSGLSSPEKVVNAVFLSRDYSPNGLFVFLGAEGKVIECPVDLFKTGGKSIEEYPDLRHELSNRITLKALLSRDETDFKYSQGLFKLDDGFWIFPDITFKVPYQPIIFGAPDSVDDVFEELYERQAHKMMSDIDTLSSTFDERNADQLLEFASDALAMLSMSMGPPGSGVILRGLTLLFGLGSSAADYARGLVADDPKHSDQHKANGIRGAVFELAAPFLGKLLGKTFSKAASSRISATIIERMKSLGHLPQGVVKYLPDYSKGAEVLSHATNKIPKWIKPVVKDAAETAQKFENKFKSYRVVNKLNRLKKGPEVAQKLMDKSRVVYFAGPKEGYVYKGFVMRGDMRPPAEIFEDGFKLRTPVTDVSQVNGMKGGFGGGKNALDPDGAGISASSYYKDAGAGAYFYGGGRGGHTYVIDARELTGYDLYKNHNYFSLNPSETGFKSLEINYGTNIPGSKVLGAYDAKGDFIPNPRAINRSLAASAPVPLNVEAVPLPFKNQFQNKNFTTTLHPPVS